MQQGGTRPERDRESLRKWDDETALCHWSEVTLPVRAVQASCRRDIWRVSPAELRWLSAFASSAQSGNKVLENDATTTKPLTSCCYKAQNITTLGEAVLPTEISRFSITCIRPVGTKWKRWLCHLHRVLLTEPWAYVMGEGQPGLLGAALKAGSPIFKPLCVVDDVISPIPLHIDFGHLCSILKEK